MKKLLFTLLIIAGAFSISVIYSCKKNDTTPASNPGNTDATTVANNNTFADDQNMTSSENDQVNSDVTYDVENNHNSTTRMSSGAPATQTTSICGATVSTSTSGDSLIYNFDGSTNCYGRTRSGQIVVSLANGPWHNAGAVLAISFNGYEVTRLYDGKTISFNGSKTVADDSGFTWSSVLNGSAISYTERVNNLQVTFSGGATANWNSHRTSRWSLTGGVIYFSCIGDSVSGSEHISEWGTTRFGNSYIMYYNSPITANSSCYLMFPTSGQVVYVVNGSTLTLTLGTNQTGSAVGTSATIQPNCPEYFNLAWVLADGSNGSAVVRYY